MTSFKEIREIGSKVREIYLQDQKQSKWFQDISEQFNNNQINIDETLEKIINYLNSSTNDESIKLSKTLLAIKEDEDPENILFNIFNQSEEEEPPEDEHEILIDSSSDEENYNQNSTNPQKYFDQKITKIKQILAITDDLSYLLLKACNWDENKVIQLWTSKSPELIQKLNLPPESPLYSSSNDSTLVKGECPICLEENDLLQLLCGHKICKKCLQHEVQTMIKAGQLPVCCLLEESSKCEVEIVPSIVQKCLENQELLERYKQLKIDSEIRTCPQTKMCPFCHILITPMNEIWCNTCKCPKCHYSVCMKCNNGPHAPLTDCKQIDQFKSEIATKFEELKEAQDLWFERELRLREYRKQNQEEPTRYFDEFVAKNEQKFKVKSDEEIQQIEKEIESRQKELERISNIERNEEVEDKIQKLKLNIATAKNAIKDNQQNRQFIHEVKQIRSKYFNLINAPMNNYTECNLFTSINFLISDYLKRDGVDVDVIRCPKCNTLCEKQAGSNYMRCICGHEFCSICLKEWSTHQDGFFCPDATNKKKNIHVYNGVDYEDEKDKSFYPMPRSIDDLIRAKIYDNCKLYYDEENLRLSAFKKDECLKNLAEVYKKVTNEKSANESATKVVNDTIFAMSVLANGQIKLFFCYDNEIEYGVLKFRLNDLKINVDKMISLLNDNKIDLNDVARLNELINKSVDAVLHS